MTDSCQAQCATVKIPAYELDPDLSLAENVAESTKQAENRPISLKGLAVSTPKELESKVTGLLDNSDTESESEDRLLETFFL